MIAVCFSVDNGYYPLFTLLTMGVKFRQYIESV